MIWMYGVDAKNHPMRSGGLLPPRSAFKSFNAQLAIDYPAYAIVICQHSHIKDVNNICWLIPWSFELKLILHFTAQYLTKRLKMTYFVAR